MTEKKRRGGANPSLVEKPAGGLREQNRLFNRERIYQAAVAVIVERGFDATTMDDIAARAGTARRTVFNHFPAKGDITYEWADRRRSRAAEAAQEAVGTSGKVIDRVRAFFRELVGITEEAPEETRQMLIGWLTSQGPVYNWARISGRLSEWLAAGHDDGTIDSAVDPVVAANVLYDVYLGVLFRWMEQPSQAGALGVDLAKAVDLVLDGLRPRAS
ncbi:TetR/AcrR family transcriptional regulator [Micromonospora sp. WMMD737]|uniref:TetR/AcrR family transcriptional regulator n=1 Tax=Micromonospora sp. WMMD737 TaxID=3404113 RepID=UPI003B93F8BF